MDQILKTFPVQDVALFFFLLGVWYSDRRSSTSRRDQGKRLGDVEKDVAEFRAALRALRPRE